jgi:hypothetical protein
MVVVKSTVDSDIWRLFYDRIKAQVTSVSITGPATITIQNYGSDFPDNLIDKSSEYPILLVEDPELPAERETLGRDKMNGSIKATIFTTQKEAASKFISAIRTAIETYRPTLFANNITDVFPQSTMYDNVRRGQIKIHMKSITFNFKFRYNIS